MIFKVTWDDGSTEKFRMTIDDEGMKLLKRKMHESFSTTLLMLGDPVHSWVSLEKARKVEIFEE